MLNIPKVNLKNFEQIGQKIERGGKHKLLTKKGFCLTALFSFIIGVYFVILGLIQSNSCTAGVFGLKNKAEERKPEPMMSPLRKLRVSSLRSRNGVNEV